MAQETKMQTEEKNNAKKMLGKKKLPLKVFKFFKIHIRSHKCLLFLLELFRSLLPFVKWCKQFALLCVIHSIPLAASFQPGLLHSCHMFIIIKKFYLNT